MDEILTPQRKEVIYILANKKIVFGISLFSTVFLSAAGLLIGSSKVNAQENPTTAPVQGSFDSQKGGHVGKNGIKEELLTEEDAEKLALPLWPRCQALQSTE